MPARLPVAQPWTGQLHDSDKSEKMEILSLLPCRDEATQHKIHVIVAQCLFFIDPNFGILVVDVNPL